MIEANINYVRNTIEYWLYTFDLFRGWATDRNSEKSAYLTI
jgi:hypothetical protein